MSERYTSATARHIKEHPFLSVIDFGRRTRAEMLRQFREHYTKQLEEAHAALGLKDDEIVTETYLGSVVIRNREPVE